MLRVPLDSPTQFVQPQRMFQDKHTLRAKRHHTEVISGRYAICTIVKGPSTKKVRRRLTGPMPYPAVARADGARVRLSIACLEFTHIIGLQ